MLLQKKAADTLMEPVMRSLMRAYEALPWRQRLIVDDDESPPQLTEIQPFGRLAKSANRICMPKEVAISKGSWYDVFDQLTD